MRNNNSNNMYFNRFNCIYWNVFYKRNCEIAYKERGIVVYENKQIETMNVQQLALLLRSLGMKVSEQTISAGIVQGKYPFGIFIETDSGGRKFEIYSKLVHDWIDERCTPA